MPGKMLVIPLNTDKLIDSDRGQSLEAVNIIKEKINGITKGGTCANGGKIKYIIERGINCGIANSLSRGFIHHACDQFI